MNYTRLANESSKLFEAFRQDGWNDEWAYELTKSCIREFPIFREMIEKEQTPEQIIGYVYFVEGKKELIYKTENESVDSVKIYTENNIYRQVITEEYNGMSFYPVKRVAYYKYNFDKNCEWTRIFDIDRIEIII